MHVTRTALSWAGSGREPAGPLAPAQDPRAWFESPACLPMPGSVHLGGVREPGLAVAPGDLERRFLDCLCMPGEGVPAA